MNIYCISISLKIQFSLHSTLFSILRFQKMFLSLHRQSCDWHIQICPPFRLYAYEIWNPLVSATWPWGSSFFITGFWQDIRGSIRAVLFGVIDRYIKLLSLVEYIHVGKPCSVPSIDNRCPSAERHYPYIDESNKVGNFVLCRLW